jgi:hypothetical protein
MSMSNADEYRRNADECMEWAKTAKSDFERNTFLQMAQTWLAAAMYADGRRRGRKSDPGRAPSHGPPPPARSTEDRPQ